MGDNAIRIEVTDATGKQVDAGSVWFELRMDMPRMQMQATAQLEKGQNRWRKRRARLNPNDGG